jgi:hypothetical protein
LRFSRFTRSPLAGRSSIQWPVSFATARAKPAALAPFSKLARSVLRRIRASSKQELRERIMAAIDFFNRDSVVHTWTYKLDKAA